MSIIVGCLIGMAVSATLSVILCEFLGVLSFWISVVSLAAGVIAGFVCGWKSRNLKGQIPSPNYFDFIMGVFFLLFCYRFFFWIFFAKGSGMATLDSNNFGDLPWHLTAITNLAHSRFWPENPIFTGDKFHYPFGIDMVNALLLKVGVPLDHSLPLIGFGCGLLLLLTLYLWGGGFALGSFLFSGGVAGYAALKTGIFRDYQANLAWKSLPLALYLTQRGFLFAMPAGLILLWSWRRRFITREPSLPFYVEGLLWGLMPLFHVHTFIFLSALFAAWVVIQGPLKEGARILALAFVPATYEMLRLTDNFKKSSLISFKPGWMIEKQNIFVFFWTNYGLYVPLALGALILVLYKKDRARSLVIVPAAAIYGICLFVMFAPWDWDNTKIMVWGYLMALPVMWDAVLKPLQKSIRIPAVAALFLSGFVCVYGVYADPQQGYEIYNREMVDSVCEAIKTLPHQYRFATAQTHNHPVLLCGHMVVAGYAGHLWSQGVANHEGVEAKLHQLLAGQPNWRQLAKEIGARYIFWGQDEQAQYPSSPKPWEIGTVKVVEGPWGRIYDLGDQP